MSCINNSSSLHIFVSDFPSYGLIGLIIIGLLLYISYLITYIRNSHTSSTIYIYLSQIFLFCILISSITFLFQLSISCLIQTLTIQIFPFFLLLCFNIHFIHQWLLKTTKNSEQKLCLIRISSFLIFLLAILIQTSILLLWFYNYSSEIFSLCSNECSRPLFLCSLILNFLFLLLYTFQSSFNYHFSHEKIDFIYLLTSLLSLSVTITWICLYLFIKIRSSLILYMNNNSILAYGNIFFVYSFLGPLLFQELFYQNKKEHLTKPKKLTFKCLSLTKEQQRVFMAAYIKRNLTASCENLTTITISPLKQLSPTCHSTLSADSLCPTIASTVSHDLPLKTNSSNSETMASEYLLMSK